MPRRSVDQLLANVEGMRRLARRLVNDPSTADDVTQDAIVIAMTRKPRYGGNLKGWLNGIVRNVARDRRRKEARRVRREDAAPPRRPSEPVVDLAVQAAEQKRMIDAVTALPEPYRRAVWRRYFENMPPRAIAREDGVPVETVRTWIKRAHGLLRAKLDEAHGGDRRSWAVALAPLAAGGGALGLPTLIGGTVVAAKSKPILLTALVLLVGGALFWMLRDDTSAGSLESDSPPLTAGTETTEGAALEGRGTAPAATAPAVPADPALRVEGRVIDERGEPLPGAELRIGPVSASRLDELTTAARSGSDGAFAFARPAQEGAVRIAAVAPGRLAAFALVEPGATDPVTLRLPRVPTFTFRVLDGTTDEPLEGVHCETRRVEHRRTWTVRRQTDAEGRVAMPSPVPHALDFHFNIRFEHPGYRPITSIRRGSLGRTTGTPERPREIYLFPTQGLALEVRDDRDRPVEGARVRAWSGGGHHSSFGPEWEVRHVGAAPLVDDLVFLGEARTDGAGRARLGEAPRNVVWHARAETDDAIGFLWGSSLSRKGKTLVIKLLNAVCVRGRVLDEAGEPVPNAVVQTMPWEYAKSMQKGGRVPTPPGPTKEGLHTRSAADGRYELKLVGIPAAPDKAYVQAHRGDLGFAFAHVELPSPGAASAQVDLQFETKGEYQDVRVVDAEGAPIAGVIAMWENVLPGTITGADGRARLRVYPGQRHRLTARSAGYVGTKVAAPESGAEVEIVLTKAVPFSGRLVDPEGNGHEGHVDFYDPSVAKMKKEEQTQIFGPHWHGRAIAGASGHFHVTGLPPGPWYVGYWYTTRRDDDYHTVRGDAVVAGTEPVVLELPEVEPPVTRGATVLGTVVDADGQPLTEYRLYLKKPKRTYAPILVGRRFRIEDVPAGEYTLAASSGSLKTEVPVVVREAGEEVEVRVVLAPTVKLSGRLVDADGKAVKKVYLLLFPEGKESWVALSPTKDDGAFRMAGLVPGRYRVRIRTFRGTPNPVQIHDDLIVLDGTAEQAITVRAGAAGTLFTTFDDDRFLPFTEDRYEHSASEGWRHSMGATVEVVRKDGRRWKGEGLWRGRTPFPYALPPGAYELVVSTKDKQAFRGTFTIRASEETEVAVVVSR